MHTIIAVENLTPLQQELLAAIAANRGLLAIVTRVDLHGHVVAAGKQVFADSRDRTVADAYLAAIPELQAMQLLRSGAKRGHYELTNIGWEMSRKLRRSQSTSHSK